MKRLRNRHFLVSDLFLLLLASYLSFVLRLERLDLGHYWSGFFFFTGVVMIIIPPFFRAVGLYSRYWRYASIEELLLLGRTVTIAAVGAGLITVWGYWLITNQTLVPRSIPFIFLLLALAVTAAPRLIIRLGALYSQQRRQSKSPYPVLIIGAGDVGAMIVRELQHNPQLGLEVVGFIDDDPGKQGLYIHGAPVLGNRSALLKVVRNYDIQQVIIAMPTAPGTIIREVVQTCERAAVQTRIIPGIHELLGEEKVRVKQLREVNIEDLLRREPVQTNIDAIQLLTKGRSVLVTGGGGSIGSELCRQLAQVDPAHLILLGHGENSIFHIYGELQERFPTLKVTPVIADIRDRARLHSIYQEHRPTIVFHAAAHKHVPLMEANPCESITNNVLGTRNLVELAVEYDVSHFVMISTDKAVNPTNIMGASKRCAERIVHKVAEESGKFYVAVRFGNVLGSRGSVVPIFKRQIADGGPVTITHPEMRRYFMTIPEAVQLVLQAAVLGKGGEVFVLDMGEPVLIADLACDLIKLSGLRPHKDIEIKFTGIRPGEKLYEELFIEGEAYERTCHEKIFVAGSASQVGVDLTLEEKIDRLISAAQEGEYLAIPLLLQQVVPEYQPSNHFKEPA